MIKVYYPYGGFHYMLHWWSYNERGHVVLCKSEGSMLRVANRIFSEHTNAEIKSYQYVEIVAPPLEYNDLYNKFNRSEAISNFNGQIRHRLHDVVKSGRALPPQFSVCGEYSPTEEEYRLAEWAIESHHSCRSCDGGIVSSLTQEQLYDMYADKWEMLFPKPVRKDERLPSKGRSAGRGEVLHYALANFGHHANGIVLSPLIEAQDLTHRPLYVSDNVLFYYNVVRECDSGPLQSMLNATMDAYKRIRQANDRAFRAWRAAIEREEIEKTVRVFTE